MVPIIRDFLIIPDFTEEAGEFLHNNTYAMFQHFHCDFTQPRPCLVVFQHPYCIASLTPSPILFFVKLICGRGGLSTVNSNRVLWTSWFWLKCSSHLLFCLSLHWQQSELLHILPVSIASYLPYIPSRLATRHRHEFHYRKSPKSRWRELFRPQGGWSRNEVMRGWLASLEGFSFAFCTKNGEWSHYFGVSGYIVNNENIEYACVSPVSKDQICLLCARVITNKSFQACKVNDIRWAETTKACFGRKISNARVSFKMSRRAIAEKKGAIINVNKMASVHCKLWYQQGKES